MSPLTDVEKRLVLPVYRRWMVACAVSDIADGNGDPTWACDHLLLHPLD